MIDNWGWGGLLIHACNAVFNPSQIVILARNHGQTKIQQIRYKIAQPDNYQIERHTKQVSTSKDVKI